MCCGLLALLGAGCADSPPPQQQIAPGPAADMPALELRIYTMIEQERHRRDPKAHELALDPELVAIARQRSTAMASKDSFSVGDPHASASMLMDQDAAFQGLIGENLAAQRYETGKPFDVDGLAKRFVQGWLASKPHEDNLSFPDYDRTGIGAAANGSTIYVTQLFTTSFGPAPESAPKSKIERVPSPEQGKDDAPAVPLRGSIPGGGPQ